jgi:hypothetical protein
MHASRHRIAAGLSGESHADEGLPPFPRHWRNWKTVKDEAGLLLVVRPQQLELPISSQEQSTWEEEDAKEAGALLKCPKIVCMHCVHSPCSALIFHPRIAFQDGFLECPQAVGDRVYDDVDKSHHMDHKQLAFYLDGKIFKRSFSFVRRGVHVCANHHMSDALKYKRSVVIVGMRVWLSNLLAAAWLAHLGLCLGVACGHMPLRACYRT